MKQTQAGASFARLSTVLNLLHAHPAGLRMDYLAQQVGVPEVRLRQEILDFYAADTLGVRPDTIVFVSAEGREDDPGSAEMVRVVTDKPAAELGVEMMSLQDWLAAYATASWISEMQPDNAALAAAVEIIADRILADTPARPDSDIGGVVSKAITDHTVLDIEYSRAWKPGVVQRRIKPLRLVQTMRGWELDALQGDDELRTFLIDRIRSADAGDQSFTVPAGIEHRLAAHRQVTTVDLLVPQRYQWTVDRYAENSQVLEWDEGDVSIRADFLPPVAERVGLVLVTAPGSLVLQPAELDTAGPDMARLLLENHGLA